MPTDLIRAPSSIPEPVEYTLGPKLKPKFQTFLDARQLFDAHDPSTSQITVEQRESEGQVEIDIAAVHPFKDGTIRETLTCSAEGGRLRSKRLFRSVEDVDGEAHRTEKVNFATPLPLPEDTYPEVMLPFLLRWQPFDATRRTLYAWINDRFVAKVYYERVGNTVVKLPIGRRKAIEFIMYPDLNDWVPLGNILTKLSKPLVPKYRMWFDPNPPFHVLRFEGPYGPPGAPEIVMELKTPI